MITQTITQITYTWADRPPKTNEAEFYAWGDNFTMNEIPNFSPKLVTLTSELETMIPQINSTAKEVNDNAILANGLANFQGAWNDATLYSKGQSVESTLGSGIYYTSKVNSNLNRSVSDENYWLNNPINNKLDKDSLDYVKTSTDQDIAGIKNFTSNPTNSDTQSTNANALVKYSAVVKNTGDEDIEGVKNFTSSPTVPTPAAGDNSTKVATTEFVLSALSTQQFDKPTKGPLFIKVSPSSIKIPAGLKLTVGTESFKVLTDYALSFDNHLLIPESKTAGTDYYVYAKSDATFYISSNENITADGQIGGFHYGLVGEAEALTGKKTEADMVKIRGINEYSFWDLKYRPTASPKGMLKVGNDWYDIYLLNSEHITNGTSKANATIAAGGTTNGRAIPKIPFEYGGNGTLTYGKFTWFQACEIGKAHGKRLIDYAEFPTIAYGVNEQKSSSTNAYETVAGKVEHYSNLTSKYGIEQATGVQWIWGRDVQGIGGSAYLTGVTDSRGDIYAPASTPTAVLLGGDRGNGVNAGSRASGWNNYVWYSAWLIGCRFACDHLELA